MIDEPEIALVASPRDWAQRVHRWVADHGGARVRATVLAEQETLSERFDVLVADDTTSFLTHRLMGELRLRGKQVLGVYDPEDPNGKGELADLGVDQILPRTATAEEFVAAVTALAGAGRRLAAPPAQPSSPATPSRFAPPPAPGQTAPPGLTAPPARPPSVSGTSPAADGVAPSETGGPDRPDPEAGADVTRRCITFVASPSGGCGATEIAVALAAAVGHGGEPCVLVDADEAAPSLAQRLGLPPYPNLRAAVDAVEHHEGRLEDALRPVPGGRFLALPGLSNPRDWPALRAPEVLHVVTRLAGSGRRTIVNAGHCVEDLSRTGGPPRYAQTRLLLSAAEVIVGVGVPTPVGVARLLDWVADVRSLAPAAALHLVLNQAAVGPYQRGEVVEELTRTVPAASVEFVPLDPRVRAAAWKGTTVAAGPFTRAVAGLAATVAPPLASVPERGWRPRRRARTVTRQATS